LLISFDSPRCIFPLKISSVTGKPSEISLDVLSTEPLLEKTTYEQALGTLHAKRLEWDRTRNTNRAEREKNMRTAMQNHRSLSLAWQMYAMFPRNAKQGGRGREWSVEDLKAMGEEGRPPTPTQPLEDNSFYASSYELLDCLQVTPEKIPESAKALPRLKSGARYLTKFVRTFSPEAMRDLLFEPAIPIVAQSLSSPEGSISAGLLSQLGSNAVPVLMSASASTNPVERLNASAALGWPPDPRYTEPIRRLLKDDVPLVRLHATTAVSHAWDASFTEPFISLLHDEHMEIRNAAATWLGFHLPDDRRSEILGLLRDQDPDLQLCALRILSHTNRDVIPRADLIRLLSSPRLQTVSLSLTILNNGEWPPRPAASWPPGQAAAPARPEKSSVSSQEAAPLLTNHITLARLMGLKILEQNGDATAIDLALPCLRDTNPIVRNRSFYLLRAVSGLDLPKDEPEKWDQWWAANRASFVPRQTSR
jgi:HEAT repeat protein